MVTIEKFKTVALSFPDTLEQPHFERKAYKIIKKKIFCTLSERDKTACVLLSVIDQSVYCQMDEAMLYPVPNKWGKQGWTNIDLKKINLKLLKEVLDAGYGNVVGRK